MSKRDLGDPRLGSNNNKIITCKEFGDYNGSGFQSIDEK